MLMKRILELGTQKPHEKEPPNAWLFRVLELDPLKQSGLELRSADGCLYYGEKDRVNHDYVRLRGVEEEVRLAVESWMKFGLNPDDLNRAVSIVICNEDRTAFLLQRKDEKHPNEACRGRYSLFGGSPHVDERSRMAAYRELLEEIRFAELRRKLILLDRVGELTLPSVQWSGQYLCEISILALPNASFMRFVESIAFQDDIAESIGAVITRKEFEQILLPQEVANPGRHFLASHHEAIRVVLEGRLI